MTTDTISLSWEQPDERSDGRDDAAWYTCGDGHDLVARVIKGGRSIGVYADGEMRICVYRMGDDGRLQDYGVIRYCEELDEYGIANDADLAAIQRFPQVKGYLDTYGPNNDGFYYGMDHNSWFDLYDGSGEHLDCVHHSLTEAIEQATKIINDDTDELWTGADE